MRNVGDGDHHGPNRGATIRDELQSLGVEVVQTTDKGHQGALGPFKFSRRWYYWSVTGPVPLAVAREMYDDSIGRKDVRVAGHCGCPPPDDWAEDIGDGSGMCVHSYHIDSGAGLRLFVDTIRKHGLDGGVPR